MLVASFFIFCQLSVVISNSGHHHQHHHGNNEHEDHHHGEHHHGDHHHGDHDAGHCDDDIGIDELIKSFGFKVLGKDQESATDIKPNEDHKHLNIQALIDELFHPSTTPRTISTTTASTTSTEKLPIKDHLHWDKSPVDLVMSDSNNQLEPVFGKKEEKRHGRQFHATTQTPPVYLTETNYYFAKDFDKDLVGGKTKTFAPIEEERESNNLEIHLDVNQLIDKPTIPVVDTRLANFLLVHRRSRNIETKSRKKVNGRKKTRRKHFRNKHIRSDIQRRKNKQFTSRPFVIKFTKGHEQIEEHMQGEPHFVSGRQAGIKKTTRQIPQLAKSAAIPNSLKRMGSFKLNNNNPSDLLDGLPSIVSAPNFSKQRNTEQQILNNIIQKEKQVSINFKSQNVKRLEKIKNQPIPKKHEQHTQNQLDKPQTFIKFKLPQQNEVKLHEQPLEEISSTTSKIKIIEQSKTLLEKKKSDQAGKNSKGFFGFSMQDMMRKRSDSKECQGKQKGLHADLENNCQRFIMCHENGRSGQFVCPIGTKFNQQLGICDWGNRVKCGAEE